MAFPQRRLRRLRRTDALRRIVAETTLSADDLIAPIFVREGISEPVEISSLPGVFQHTLESTLSEIEDLIKVGVGAVIFFGVPETKDAEGSGAWDPAGIVQIALQQARQRFGDSIVLIADLCVDEYTTHGHCGILDGKGSVDNDATVELYRKIAVAQADAGADIIAPSGMMDGQVAAIREALDDAGHHDAIILAYAAKYASSFYGPFRDAVDVTIADGGDRKGYQQDPRNGREAMEEIRSDLAEGADMVMVKPAMAYLDIILRARLETDVPIVAYHVSGEYAMLKAAEANGWIDGHAAAVESLVSIKRAGADLIITYLARSIAESLSSYRLALPEPQKAIDPPKPELEP